MTLGVAVVGCGVIGRRRARIACDLGDRIVAVADVEAGRAQAVAQECDCDWTQNWAEVVDRPDVDVVVVSTINKVLAPVTIAAARAGKHVLCEKPLGRNADEAREMVDAAGQAGVILKTGFNHRHHPAVWQAHSICASGALGPVMFIRAVYGHGGRPGYDKEWRADADLSGGGELLDQGVHIVDLCRWFFAGDSDQEGEFVEAFAALGTWFWGLGYWPQAPGDLPARTLQSELPRRLEDNAFALLRTASGHLAQFHTSWTQWKNRFSFEVFGRDGYVRVEGLGGSYGIERLEVGKRRAEGGAPSVETMEYGGPDLSWQAEWQEFRAAIREGREPLANGYEGLKAMRTIAALYRSEQSGRMVTV
jgi:predicted dehydrogenase